MKGLLETTGGDFPPHIYFLTKNNEAIYGYHNCKSDTFVMFSKSINFSKRGRTFKTVSYK